MDEPPPNETTGTSRSAGASISKNSRFVKPNVPAKTRPGERLDARVVALHVAVVDAASTGDLILGVRQLGLQLLEVLGRAQLRVGLGDCEQPAERSAQRAFCLGDLRRALRAHRGRAGLRDGFEDARLVRRVALDALDEVRDQVVPALELDVDPAPALVDPVAPANHPVVDPDQEQDQDDDDDDDDDDGPHTQVPPRKGRAYTRAMPVTLPFPE